VAEFKQRTLKKLKQQEQDCPRRQLLSQFLLLIEVKQKRRSEGRFIWVMNKIFDFFIYPKSNTQTQ